MIAALIIYIVLIIAISIFVNRKGDSNSFLSSSRDRGTWSILFSKFAGAISVTTFISYTAYAYEFGFGIFGLLVGIIVGYILFGAWAAPKINALSSANNYVTQGDFVRHQVASKKEGNYSNWISALVQFFWIVMSVVGGAKIVSEFDLMPYEWAIVSMVGVVGIYTIVSGFKAVIVTDVVQALIIIVLIVVVAFGMYSQFDIAATLDAHQSKFDGGKAFGLLLYGGLSVFALSDRYQLTFAAKSPGAAKKGMLLSILPIVLVAFVLLLVGLLIQVSYPDLDKDVAFIYGVSAILPNSLFPALLVLFFAGLMSTSDTAIFAITSHVAWSDEPTQKVKQIRWLTFPILIVAGVIAYYWRDIVDITVVGVGLRLLLSIPMLYLLIKTNKKDSALRKKRVFNTILIGSISGFILGLILFGADPKLAILVLLLSLIAWFVGFLISRKH